MSRVATVRTRLGVIGTIGVVASSLFLFVGPVAATDVANDYDLRKAWANVDEDSITLTSDITLACTDGGIEPVGIDSPTRDSATAIVVDGNGHTLHNPCNFTGLKQDGVGKVTLHDLTFTGNASSGHGLATDGPAVVTDSTVTGHGEAGIWAQGDVSADGSTISDNVGGDGIRSEGNVTVSDSELNGNAAEEYSCGDGIDAGGDVDVDNSTLSGNGDNGILANGDITVADSVVADNGGAGECDQDGIATPQGAISVTRTTVSGNQGDGIITTGSVNAVDSTITNNEDDGIRAGTAYVTNSTITGQDGGTGIRTQVDVFATNATISGNGVNIDNLQLTTIHLFGTVVIDAGRANCIGGVADDGYNFVDDETCGDILPNTADPQLGALADNGGPTWTRLPGADSPLLNAIPSGDCEVDTEQRGLFARPQDAGCEIGSVEVQGAPVATPSPTPTPVPTATPVPGGTPLPTESAVPTLPPTSAAAPSAPTTVSSIALVVGLLAAAAIVLGLDGRRIRRRR